MNRIEFDIIAGQEPETGIEVEVMTYGELVGDTPVLSETDEGEYRLKVDDSLLFDEIPAVPRAVCAVLAEGLPADKAAVFEPSYSESLDIASAYRAHVGNLLAFTER